MNFCLLPFSFNDLLLIEIIVIPLNFPPNLLPLTWAKFFNEQKH